MADTIDELAAQTIIENAEEIANGQMTEYDLFDAVYGPLPVARIDGEWCVTAPEEFETGCCEDFGETNEAIKTLAELASQMGLEPWSFSQDHGWGEDKIVADRITVDYPAAAAALFLVRAEIADQIREERDFQRQCREEGDIMDRDELEIAATSRGESVEYFAGGTLAKAAAELGMPENSETARKYFAGMIHRGEALRRAEKIRHRHEATNYDDLLSRGVDRDTAREVME